MSSTVGHLALRVFNCSNCSSISSMLCLACGSFSWQITPSLSLLALSFFSSISIILTFLIYAVFLFYLSFIFVFILLSVLVSLDITLTFMFLSIFDTVALLPFLVIATVLALASTALIFFTLDHLWGSQGPAACSVSLLSQQFLFSSPAFCKDTFLGKWQIYQKTI